MDGMVKGPTLGDVPVEPTAFAVLSRQDRSVLVTWESSPPFVDGLGHEHPKRLLAQVQIRSALTGGLFDRMGRKQTSRPARIALHPLLEHRPNTFQLAVRLFDGCGRSSRRVVLEPMRVAGCRGDDLETLSGGDAAAFVAEMDALAAAKAAEAAGGAEGPGKPVDFFAVTVPGLGPLLEDECGAKLPGITTLGGFGDDVVAWSMPDPRSAATIGEVVDTDLGLGQALFVGLGGSQSLLAGDVAHDKEAAAQALGAAVGEWTADELERIVAVCRARDREVPTFRVSCMRRGRHGFASVDAAGAVAVVIGARTPWPVSLQMPDIEVFVIINGPAALIGVRVADDNLRAGNAGRVYALRPDDDLGITAMQPQIAQAMVVLAERHAGPHALICDAMVGCGTIPVAAASTALGTLVLGGDADERCVAKSVANVATHRVAGRVDLALWDARELPLRPGVVDAFVVDLPFGVRCLSQKALTRLYAPFLRRAHAALTTDGICVLLTCKRKFLLAQVKMLREHRRPAPFDVVEMHTLTVNGMGTFIVVLRRLSAEDLEHHPSSSSQYEENAPANPSS